MKKTIVSAFLCAIIALCGMDVHAALQWKHGGVKVESASRAGSDASGGIEVYSQEMSIIIKTDRKVEVKVFTILGQVVSEAELTAGTSVLEINSRGIYIVKIDDFTQKVVL